jgi:hypothetical protein
MYCGLNISVGSYNVKKNNKKNIANKMITGIAKKKRWGLTVL